MGSESACYDAMDACGRMGRRLMCPDAHHEPAFQPKHVGLPTVPCDVRLQLRSPPARMLLWPRRVPRAHMPEAAVHENDDAGRCKHDVGSNGPGCGWH